MNQQTNKTIKYTGKIIAITEEQVEFNGKQQIFEKAVRAPGVRLIIQDGNKLLLSREFRHELGTEDFRLAGGKVVDTLNEYLDLLKTDANIENLAEAAAKKEALEELGIEVKELELFNISKLGATMSWDLYYFNVKSFTQLNSQNLETGEKIEPVWVEIEEVKKMCLNGKISEERSAMNLLRFLGMKF